MKKFIEEVKCTCGDYKNTDLVHHRKNGLPCYFKEVVEHDKYECEECISNMTNYYTEEF